LHKLRQYPAACPGNRQSLTRRGASWLVRNGASRKYSHPSHLQMWT
jgi:hypothetical protein